MAVNPNWWVDLVQDPSASHLRTQRRILQGFSRYLHFGGCRHGDTSAAALARHLSTICRLGTGRVISYATD